MKAAIISVGTEHLAGKITDTNAVYISRELIKYGIKTHIRLTLPDDIKAISENIKNIIKEVDIIFTIAGLGPTHDDITKEAVAHATGQKLIYSHDIWKLIVECFKQFQSFPTPNNKKQAYYFETGKWYRNDNGTAPGLYTCDKESGTHFFLLPGPPHELIRLFEKTINNELKNIFSLNKNYKTKILRVYNAGESSFADKINPVLEEYKNIQCGIYVKTESYIELDFQLISDSGNSINEIDAFEKKIRNALQETGFLITDNIPLNRSIGSYLKENRLTIGFAESITGGNITANLVQVPGCSEYLKGGIVAYSNDIKTDLLNVQKNTITDFGAVSAECALEMAHGIRKKLGTNIGVSITGIAGPGGSTPEKPAGLCYIGISDKTGSKSVKINLFGNRQRIIDKAVIRVFTEIINYLRIY